MVNRDKFRGMVIAKGYTLGKLADEIGICRATMSFKIKTDTFTAAEIKRIVKVLGEDVLSVFFA